jgi:RNA polymerase sigma-70 factor, ECF subfamily
MEVAEVYNTFNKSLLGFIKSKVRQKEDAEDILHNVFLKITVNVHTLSKKEKLQNWLFRVTRNAIIDYYRSKSRKGIQLYDSDLLDTPEDEIPEEAIEELVGCVKPFISQLPEKYREFILESEINGVRQIELSQKYSLAYPSVRSRVQRGRERLKDIFLQCCRIDLDSRGGITAVTSNHSCPENICGPCDN